MSNPTVSTASARQSAHSNHASHAATRVFILPTPPYCSVVLSVTTPLYSSTVSQTLRQTLRRPLSKPRRAELSKYHPLIGKRCMLASLKLASDFSRGRAHPVMQPPIPTAHPHPAARKNRSPIARAPARCGSCVALPLAALYLGVEVNHHSPSARAPLASHPRTKLHVVHTPLQASRADALLVGTCTLSGHDLMP